MRSARTVEEFLAMFGCGGQVGVDGGEVVGAGQGAEAAGDFLGVGPCGSRVLSGSGPTLGEQHRHRIHFDADVRAAGWLGDLRFFLATAGHSAVLDLASSSRVQPRGLDQTRTEALNSLSS
jgi:hypothetical protein